MVVRGAVADKALEIEASWPTTGKDSCVPVELPLVLYGTDEILGSSSIGLERFVNPRRCHVCKEW